MWKYMTNEIPKFYIKSGPKSRQMKFESSGWGNYATVEFDNVFMTHTDNSDFCKVYFSGTWKFHAQLTLKSNSLAAHGSRMFTNAPKITSTKFCIISSLDDWRFSELLMDYQPWLAIAKNA